MEPLGHALQVRCGVITKQKHKIFLFVGKKQLVEENDGIKEQRMEGWQGQDLGGVLMGGCVK